MTQPQNAKQTTPLTEEQAAQAAAEELKDKELNDIVRRLVGAAMGTLEASVKSLETAVINRGAIITKIDDRMEQVELTLARQAADAKEEERKGAIALTADQTIRIRMGHSVSVKGIHTYEGSVEGVNLTNEQVMAARIDQDESMNILQPIYEEFVEPVVPGLSVGNSASAAAPKDKGAKTE